MDKTTLANFGDALMRAFCEKNGLEVPSIYFITDPNSKDYKNIKTFATCGYYRQSVIKIVPELCAHNNPMYSWPAFISDRTPYGVVQHELGHHADQVMSGFNIYRQAGALFSSKVKFKSKEKAITSYCPNDMEWFAEIFRLFVTNPDLLKQIRPKTYQILCDEGFIPIITKSAQDVLAMFNASDRVYDRMEKHVNEAMKR